MAKAAPSAVQMPSGAAIAKDAEKYAGLGYAYGGDASQPGKWDCSSFVSYVLGHDFGLALPGGGTYGKAGYPPTAHGPTVASYATWKGASTLSKNEAPAAGDLAVWVGTGPLGHIGICTSPTTMISALDATLGTISSPIAGYGPIGSPLIYRRLNGSAEAGSGSSSSGLLSTATQLITSQASGIGMAIMLGAAAPALIIGAVVLGFIILELAGGAIIIGAASRAAR